MVSSLLQPFELTPASGLALSILADAGPSLPPNEIADRLIISRAAVTSLIDSLERRGYAQRLPHPSDRRMLLVEITTKGRRVAEAFRPVVHQQQKVWFGALGDQEQLLLLEFLHRLQASFQTVELQAKPR
jgi:MarR family 2-MHQ and catechol resistance regulon transcriptional repressor